MTGPAEPDLAVGLVTIRDAAERQAVGEGAGLIPHAAEVTATVANIGEALAGETTTRFWIRGEDVDRELRIVYTPPLLPGDEVEVTALWDVRGRRGRYTLTVTANAYGQIDEGDRGNNTATVDVVVRGSRVEPA